MHPRERLAFQPIEGRPPLKFPDGIRLVVWPVFSLEGWDLSRPMARMVISPPQGVPQQPDLPNWSWHEYGMRVAFWRMRKMLDRVPNDKFDWRPHPKSMNIRELAGHTAEMPGWVAMVLTTEELDFAANPYTTPNVNNTTELKAYHENSLSEALARLKDARESSLEEMWTMRNGETIYDRSSKEDVIRMALSQTIHHRAQLGVFLRLLDVPIPGSYGPSADDSGM